MLFSDFMSLLKPRILVMQFVSFSLGYGMALPFSQLAWGPFLWGLCGVACLSGGSAALNHSLEWPWDAKMVRTHHRPVPTKRVLPIFATFFGFLGVVLGILVLMICVNGLVALLGALTAWLYVAVYTPSKRWHWINTYIGTVPGAMLPLAGWAAAAGHLGAGAFWMALVLLVWQLPHFFAIAWMYKDEYQGAGFKMVSEQDVTGAFTVAHMMYTTYALVVVAMIPYIVGLCGIGFFCASIGLGVWLLRDVYAFAHDRTYIRAKTVLKTSVYYLPIFLLAIVVDRWFG